MWGKIIISGLVLCAIVVQAGCIFKPQKYQSVISYRNQKVYLSPHRYYTVGTLPDGWKRLETRARAISFYNADSRSSIGTDAICSKQVRDRPLASLAADLLGALEDRKVVDTREMMLDERGAIRRQVVGKLDGVVTTVDMVVTRKNGCVFDFYAITPQDTGATVTDLFESFVDGFHFE